MGEGNEMKYACVMRAGNGKFCPKESAFQIMTRKDGAATSLAAVCADHLGDYLVKAFMDPHDWVPCEEVWVKLDDHVNPLDANVDWNDPASPSAFEVRVGAW